MMSIRRRFRFFPSPHSREKEERRMANPVMRWQILTKQPKKLEEFYSALFGWKVSGDNPLGYRQVDTASNEGIPGGFWPISEKEGHSMVQLFVRVNDVNASAKKAESLGARI